MQIQEFDIDDLWLQEFLWQYLVPSDIRHDYNKLDAMAHIRNKAREGDTVFIGCRESRVVFRCVQHNPKVVEPHIMGNGLRVRSVTQAAIPVAWALGYEKIVVWTQYPALAKAMLSIGFAQDAVIPRYHLHQGELLDLHVLSITKGDHDDDLQAKTLLTR
jgi:hypothetical protein